MNYWQSIIGIRHSQEIKLFTKIFHSGFWEGSKIRRQRRGFYLSGKNKWKISRFSIEKRF